MGSMVLCVMLQHNCNIPLWTDLESISELLAFESISLGTVSVSYISECVWFGFMCNLKLFTSASMLYFYGVVMEKFIGFVYCSQNKSGVALEST